MAEAEVQLYQPRVPIFPRSVSGRFRRLKYAILVLAYGVYFLLPWVRWDRPSGSDQAVMFDIVGRRFYLFDLVVDATEMFWLAGLLFIAAILLFFVTGVAGRVFCGYFCFQTLWTDVFIRIERLVQGERPKRMRLAKAPWGSEKLAKYGLTWSLWLLVALATGITFTLYWANAPELVVQLVTGAAPFSAYATSAFLTLTTFVFAGLAREQVCTYMCPYARFQSAMFDRDTLIIAYDRNRGEGSAGRHKLARQLKGREQRLEQGVGDCVDCGYCVQVCPTGIDIRNGLQLECISCGLCVDACDSIMDNLEWPRGLIRYTSENALEGKPTRLLKANTVGYGLVLVIAIVLLSWSVATRESFGLAAEQLRQPLAVVLSDGRIQNRYEIKINNKLTDTLEVQVSMSGLPSATLDLGHFETLTVQPGQRLRLMVYVRMPADAQPGQHQFEFIAGPVNRPDMNDQRRTTTFYVPSR
jgi:cytochrome c oxidase accessory protein FixG